MENDLWVHHKPPEWNKMVHKPVYEKCAWMWNETINIIKNDRKNIPKEDFIEIFYEDLIENPKKIMKNLFGVLNLPLSFQIELCQKIQNKMENSYQAKVSDRWTRNNHSKRIRRFEEKPE